MKTTEIAGITYTIGKLEAFEQMHVARRILPILPYLVGAFASHSGELSQDSILEIAMGGFADAFAKMSDDDVNFVTWTCLGVCKRKQEQNFARVMANKNTLAFDDIELDTILGLTVAVVEENLARFFPISQPK